VKDVGLKRGDERDRVVVKVVDTGEEPEEVALDKFFQWNPKFLTTVVNDLVLVRVTVNGEGAGRGMKEIQKKIS